MSSRRSENTQRAAAPLASYEFDFGLGSAFNNRSSSNSLNAQKQQRPPSSSYSSFSGGGGAGAGDAARTGGGNAKPAYVYSSSTSASYSSSPAAAAWSSQNASLNAPMRSMVGDISGKSWASMPAPPPQNTSTTEKSGLVGGLSRGATPDLFGDLLIGSMSRSSAPIKHASPSVSFNMDSMMASLPRGAAMKDAMKAKSADPLSSSEMGDFISGSTSISATAAGTATSSQSKDTWSTFASGPPPPVKQVTKGNEDPFGDFQAAPTGKPATVRSTPQDPFAASSQVNVDLFSSFSNPSGSNSTDFFSVPPQAGSSNATQKVDSNADPFSFLNVSKSSTPTRHNSNGSNAADPFSSLLGSSVYSNAAADVFASRSSKIEDPIDKLFSSTKPETAVSSQNFETLADDWGMEADFGGEETGNTTELEGLPPPPPGVSAMLAKQKGLENYKQGQFADAIKWLSWAEMLLDNSGDNSMVIEVLSCRASCLKEAGEYKKAIADCSKVVELDGGNTVVLLQRALLYESTEKYKLGVADLREVLRREPQNRVASNTLSRLVKMAE